MDKLRYIHGTKYYPAMKRNEALRHALSMNEPQKQAKWKEPDSKFYIPCTSTYGIFMWYFCKGETTGTEKKSVVTRERGWAVGLTTEVYGGILEKMELLYILIMGVAAQIYVFINTPWTIHIGWILPYVNYTLILKMWSQSWNLSSRRLCQWPWHRISSQPFLKRHVTASFPVYRREVTSEPLKISTASLTGF